MFRRVGILANCDKEGVARSMAELIDACAEHGLEACVSELDAPHLSVRARALPEEQFDRLLGSAYVERCVIPFLCKLPKYTHVTALEDVQSLKGDGKRAGVGFAMHVVASTMFVPILRQEARFRNLTIETMSHVRHAVQPELFWYEAMRRTLQDSGRVPYVGDGEVYQVALPAFYTQRKQHAGSAVQKLIERVRCM